MSEEQINKLESLHNKIYEQTQEYGRTQFVSRIVDLQQENQQLKEQLDKATRVALSEQRWASKCEDRCINYQSVLDEIREQTKSGVTSYNYGGSRTSLFEVLVSINEILDKVKE